MRPIIINMVWDYQMLLKSVSAYFIHLTFFLLPMVIQFTAPRVSLMPPPNSKAVSVNFLPIDIYLQNKLINSRSVLFPHLQWKIITFYLFSQTLTRINLTKSKFLKLIALITHELVHIFKSEHKPNQQGTFY